jgi:lysyl-tRNA synthetase class 2
VWLASDRRAEEGAVLRETIALFFFTHGSMSFRDEFGWVPVAVSGMTLALTVVAGALLFRPRRPPGALPSDETRAETMRLVEEHGSDTLAFFKLRRDLQYLFSRSRDAFLGYRTENGVLLVAGDPLGPAHAVRELIRDACAFAEAHGLRIAVLGASDRLVPTWRDAGLRTMYLGDEAIVDLRAFSLEGRAIRKVRQSVNRLVGAGYEVDVLDVAGLDPAELAELERVSVSWRTSGPERGFAMAMDALAGGVVIVARDGDGAARGLLHFVPTHGRAAASLALMRGDRTSPNGLTEFLVVRAIESLRERGIEELSLNFVAFGRLIERPLARRLLVAGNRWFQLESLHRFSTKFSPRWQPRFFMFDGVLGLPRAGLAALVAEGQIPRLRS